MRKEEIVKHYESFSLWLESLKKVEQKRWQQPVSEGKWPVAAVVAHLLFWDRYSLKERFPLFKEGAELESFPDFQSVNDAAKKYAAKHDQIEIISELLTVREQFLKMLHNFTEENMDTSFMIGKHSLTIRDYFVDFVEHDLHHKKQIMEATGVDN
ncbi:DinB family protein [Bacillus sp. ISL-47]|uniref:DinB family protein n=1 Tax=Bacillus sp. ISL-47 TaxID=2819130 RepID=UPI001BECC29E|nr:DinB family protein [Bacillus sp. ISL-47]MBT2687817.1 DinB family protein [Bacillus sp. ISL-47]MBT2708106.1 DinB family protein [Pseudomonas sp. ISL-84]